MKQRTLLVSLLILMLVLAVVMSVFFTSLFSGRGSALTTTPTPVVTPTDTPEPTPTDTPTPVPTTPTPSPTPTPPPLVNGSSAYLMDVSTGRVLLNTINGPVRVPMWSTTKVMTALLAIENLPLDQVETITQSELNEVPAGMSVAQLHANDQLSVEHLLYGLLLPSGSDAAVVLAHSVSGSTASFVALMNSRAAQLGLKNTHY